jgi:hypothetical protein
MKRLALVLGLLLTALVVAASAAAAPNGIFTMSFTGQRANIDPVAAPGVFPTAHQHTFYCARDVTPTSNTASLRVGGTSCAVAGNHTGYWVETPMVNGVPLAPATTKHALAYYGCPHGTAICSTIAWFPDNFGFVVGNANATSAADNPALNSSTGGWRCQIGGGSFSPVPNCVAGDTLVWSLKSGSCIMPDGSLAKLVGQNCLGMSGRPVLTVQMYARYEYHGGTVTLDGHPAYQLHMDRLEGFLPATAQSFLDKCVHPDIACGQDPAL